MHLKKQQPDKALELVEVTRQKGLQPDRIMYSAAISAREKAKQPDKLLELLGVMRLKRHGARNDHAQRSYQCM